MKRILTILLALALCLAWLPAMAVEGNALIRVSPDAVGGYTSVFSDGDTLYLRSLNGIGVWKRGDAAPEMFNYEIPEGDNTIQTAPFFADGKLYAFRVRPNTTEDGEIELDSARLCEMTLSGGEATFEEVQELEWDALMSETEDGVDICMPYQIVNVGGYTFMLYYDEDRYGDFTTHLAALDMEDGSIELMDSYEYIWNIAPYGDDRLLMLARESGEDEAEILIYDPEEEDDDSYATLELEEGVNPAGLAYDPAQETVYLSLNNEVHAVDEEGEIGDALTLLPLQNNDPISPACMLGGAYVFCHYQVAVMDLSGERPEPGELFIDVACDTGALQTVLQDFQVSHSNIQVHVRRGEEILDNLVENLINQDGSVDIYVLEASQPVYESLCRRGFMAPLDKSSVISDSINAMYPAVRDKVTVNGQIVAIPVDAQINALGVGRKALEALGMTLDDIPTNWRDFLDFLPTLEDELSEENGVLLSYEYESAQGMREKLFNLFFKDYQTCMSLRGDELSYNTDLMRDMTARLDAVDFEALGLYSLSDDDEDDEEEEGDDSGTEEVLVLLDPLFDCTFNSEAMSAFTPVLLGVDEQDRGSMTATVTVAFINPYCKNPDTALAFMETMIQGLQHRVSYSFLPGLTEPIRGAVEEAKLREIDDNLRNLNTQLENASGARRVMLQGEIELAEESREEAEKSSWDISQACVDWYRAHGDQLAVAPSDWLDAQSRDLIHRYCYGETSGSDMLQHIDEKLKMMRMEGY